MKKTFKRLAAMLLVLAMVLTMLAGCGEQSSNTPSGGETNVASDTLTWLLPTDIFSLDPAQSYDETTNIVNLQMYEGLLAYDRNINLECDLLESWEIVDPLTYVYNVKPGITFSDGNPMTMDDVLFSVQRHMDPEVGSLLNWMFASVDYMEQTGDWQFTVHLTAPDATWQYTFATTGGVIIEKAAYEKDGSFIGTGAYKLDSWQSGTQVVLSRNEYYTSHDQDIFFNKIVFNVIEEDTTRVEALISGQADVTMNPPLDMLDQLEAADNLNVNMFETFGEDYIDFNLKRAPFNDVNVRRAVCAAIDLKEIHDGLLEGVAAESTGLPFGPAMYGQLGKKSDWETYAASYNKYPANIEKAKEYLAASAYPNGFDCSLVVGVASYKNSMALYIQSVLAQIGINMKINKVTDYETYDLQGGHIWDDVNQCPDFDMAMFTWYADYPDIAGQIIPLAVSTNVGVDGNNAAGYESAVVDELLAKQLALTDGAERAEVLRQALDVMEEDIPMLTLCYPLMGAITNKSITQAEFNACYIWDISIKDWARQ